MRAASQACGVMVISARPAWTAWKAHFYMQAFGEAGERKLGGNVGQQVRDRDLAADRRDVDDAAARLLRRIDRIEQVREGGVNGVEGGEEVGLHGSLISFERLVFKGANLDDAGVVDQQVEPPEGFHGGADERLRLFRVGEVAGNQQDVVFLENIAGAEDAVAGEFEFVGVAGGENEFKAGASEAVRECEPQAARAAGDHGHLAGMVALASGQKRIGGGGRQGGDDQGQGEVEAGLAHGE